MIQPKDKIWYPIGDESGKTAIILIVGMFATVFLFSLYVLLTTKNTIIVVNEAVNKPEEIFLPDPSADGPLPKPEVVAPAVNPRIQILETGVGFLNVRNGASQSATKIGTVKPGEVYEYAEVKTNWYHIIHPTLKEAWVSGEYVKEVDRSSDLFGR